MCLRISAVELIGNLLGSRCFKDTDVLSWNNLKKFSSSLSRVVPGYIYYDIKDSDIGLAVQEFSFCCSVDRQWNFRLKRNAERPDRALYNRALDKYTAEALAEYADYFADTKLEGKKDADSLNWSVKQRNLLLPSNA